MPGEDMVNSARLVLYVPHGREKDDPSLYILPSLYDPNFLPYQYAARVCSQWDQRGNRFLVSVFHGGLGAVPFKPGTPALLVHEEVLVPQGPHPGLSNLGFRIDYPRNRVVCCASDKRHFALSTIVAYDYTTWKTLFKVVLQTDKKSLANDLALDPDGNIYIPDSINGKIWRVASDGRSFSVFCADPIFQLKPQSDKYRWVKLNGIAYHRKRFLLVTHTGASALFKVSMDGKTVRKVQGLTRELLGAGVVLLDDNQLAMAGLDSGCHLLVTNDDWESAVETQWSPTLARPKILPTSVSLKDGCPFVGYVNLDLIPFNTIADPPFLPTPGP